MATMTDIPAFTNEAFLDWSDPENVRRMEAALEQVRSEFQLAAAGADIAVGVKRNTAVVRAWRAIPADAWRPAIGMHDAEVAEALYRPAGWPPVRARISSTQARPVPVTLTTMWSSASRNRGSGIVRGEPK